MFIRQGGLGFECREAPIGCLFETRQPQRKQGRGSRVGLEFAPGVGAWRRSNLLFCGGYGGLFHLRRGRGFIGSWREMRQR